MTSAAEPAPHLLVQHGDGFATLTLNGPDKHNALSPEMVCRLADAWDDIAADPTIRVAVVTGAGDRAFCTGADLGRVIPLFTGARPPEDKGQLGQLMHSFFVDDLITVKGLRPASVRGYRDTMRLLLRYVAEDKGTKITKLDLDEPRTGNARGLPAGRRDPMKRAAPGRDQLSRTRRGRGALVAPAPRGSSQRVLRRAVRSPCPPPHRRVPRAGRRPGRPWAQLAPGGPRPDVPSARDRRGGRARRAGRRVGPRRGPVAPRQRRRAGRPAPACCAGWCCARRWRSPRPAAGRTR